MMAEIKQSGVPFIDLLRQYVLSPLSDAQALVRDESEEIKTEQQAFQQFNERIADIEPISATPIRSLTQHRNSQNRSQRVERLRNAYRETVMNVSHYETVYDESLDTNAAAELSPEVATGLQYNSTPFTDLYKKHLTTAIDQAITQREKYCNRLGTEQESLARGREILTTLVTSLDGSRIPDWYISEFESELSELAETRQQTLRGHDGLGYIDRHDLCRHLYAKKEWTYPVLTAIARVDTIVDSRKEHERFTVHPEK